MKEQEPNSSGTQYHVFFETKKRPNQKVIKKEKDEVEVKTYPKKKKNY